MKNIYKTIEKNYLKQSKSKTFNENEFNAKVEEVIKTLYPESKGFDVIKLVVNGRDYIYVQGVMLDSDENKKMYLTSQNNYAFVYKMAGSNQVAHNGFLTCEDIRNNLKIKEENKNISKEF